MTNAPKNKYLMNLSTILYSPAVKQLVFIVSVAGSVALGMALFLSMQEPTYMPLDYQVTTQNMTAIVDTLEKAGITYKINEQDNMLYVAAKDLQRARLRLAGAGVVKDDSFNFAYLNDQGSIGNSQFLENARYLRALESDLSRTISGIEGISGARVHIAMPQNNIFADENQRPTASVVVNTAPGLSTDKEKVRAIVQIVAGSVPGLDPNDVSVTDQYGHFLSAISGQDDILNADHLNYQNSLQGYYEKRITSMISPLLGDNKVNVRVYANIDFTQQEEAQEQYDPDHKVVRSEQSVSEHNSSAGASGPPGSLSNSPPENDTDAKNADAGSADGRTESVRNFEVSKSVSYKKATHPKVVSLSVAVVMDNEMVLDPQTHKYVSKPLSQDKINKITELVKATIGFDEKRGDKVMVINSTFNNVPAENLVSSPAMWNQPWFWDVVKKIIGFGIGLVVLMFIYKRVASYLKTGFRPPRIDVDLEEELNESRMITQQMRELKDKKIGQLKDMASKDPNRIAIIIKNWVGK